MVGGKAHSRSWDEGQKLTSGFYDRFFFDVTLSHFNNRSGRRCHIFCENPIIISIYSLGCFFFEVIYFEVFLGLTFGKKKVYCN